jgi:hypothetical protein
LADNRLVTRPKKSNIYPSPSFFGSAAWKDEPFDFDGEKVALRLMTEDELIQYGRKYAELAKLHTVDSPPLHSSPQSLLIA